jgi:hypothetical protein
MLEACQIENLPIKVVRGYHHDYPRGRAGEADGVFASASIRSDMLASPGAGAPDLTGAEPADPRSLHQQPKALLELLMAPQRLGSP